MMADLDGIPPPPPAGEQHTTVKQLATRATYERKSTADAEN
jgi:hypothetical protein